jgi:hypothetical protein
VIRHGSIGIRRQFTFDVFGKMFLDRGASQRDGHSRGPFEDPGNQELRCRINRKRPCPPGEGDEGRMDLGTIRTRGQVALKPTRIFGRQPAIDEFGYPRSYG